jgi:hypothetical protein
VRTGYSARRRSNLVASLFIAFPRLACAEKLRTGNLRAVAMIVVELSNVVPHLINMPNDSPTVTSHKSLAISASLGSPDRDVCRGDAKPLE